MTNSSEPMCYIGTKPECGCIIGSILVGSVPAKLLGKQVAAWIEEGYNSEFVTHSYVTENWGVCDHRVKQLPLQEQPPAPPPADEPTLTYEVATDGTVENLSLNGTDPHGESDEEEPFPDYEPTDHDDIVMAEFNATEES